MRCCIGGSGGGCVVAVDAGAGGDKIIIILVSGFILNVSSCVLTTREILALKVGKLIDT